MQSVKATVSALDTLSAKLFPPVFVALFVNRISSSLILRLSVLIHVLGRQCKVQTF